MTLPVFVHRPNGSAGRCEWIGRIDREQLPAVDARPAMALAFLTYNLVFPSSGLPAGLAAWQRALVRLVADPSDWHQLDHYTAVTIAVEGLDVGRPRAIAAILQQHNYQRAYLIASTAGPGYVVLGNDGRLAVDAALGSNELYPHLPGRRVHRAAPMLDAGSAPWLILGRDRPMFSADDVTDPQTEVDCGLAFLPPSDAFYVFQGWLGERRRLPGRDGPPGADYYTLPETRSRALQLALFWWFEDDRDGLALLGDAFARPGPGGVALDPFWRRLASGLEHAR